MANYFATDTDLTSVANAIRTKGGTSAQLSFPSGFVSAIQNIPTGGGSVDEKDVNFYDYDGTLLYSYTKAQALALSALPENPSHEGLTAQGWNWTLAEIQAELTTYPDQFIQVGQNYITTSGKTEIDFVLDDSNYLSPCLRIGLNGTATIEWGDGSQETVSGNSINTSIYIQHTYSQTGNYTIKIDVSNYEFTFISSSDYASVLQDGTTQDTSRSRIYAKNINHIRIGNKFKLMSYAFSSLSGLQTITVPKSLPSGSTPAYVFFYSTRLKCFVFPCSEDLTKTGASFFSACESLKTVSISKKITELGNYFVQYCTSLKRLGMPSSITKLGNYSFSYCFNLEEMNLPGVTTTGENTFEICYKIKKVKMPNLSGDVKAYTFQNDYDLTDVTIPNNALIINAYAFSNCKTLPQIVLPSTLQEIKNNAFYGNNTLKSATIPANVTAIGNMAFGGCYGITEYHFKPAAPPTLGGSNVFLGIQSTTKIYVPAASVEDYKTAQYWSSHASKIQEEPQ